MWIHNDNAGVFAHYSGMTPLLTTNEQAVSEKSTNASDLDASSISDKEENTLNKADGDFKDLNTGKHQNDDSTAKKTTQQVSGLLGGEGLTLPAFIESGDQDDYLCKV